MLPLFINLSFSVELSVGVSLSFCSLYWCLFFHPSMTLSLFTKLLSIWIGRAFESKFWRKHITMFSHNCWKRKFALGPSSYLWDFFIESTPGWFFTGSHFFPPPPFPPLKSGACFVLSSRCMCHSKHYAFPLLVYGCTCMMRVEGWSRVLTSYQTRGQGIRACGIIASKTTTKHGVCFSSTPQLTYQQQLSFLVSFLPQSRYRWTDGWMEFGGYEWSEGL